MLHNPGRPRPVAVSMGFEDPRVGLDRICNIDIPVVNFVEGFTNYIGIYNLFRIGDGVLANAEKAGLGRLDLDMTGQIPLDPPRFPLPTKWGREQGRIQREHRVMWTTPVITANRWTCRYSFSSSRATNNSWPTSKWRGDWRQSRRTNGLAGTASRHQPSNGPRRPSVTPNSAISWVTPLLNKERGGAIYTTGAEKGVIHKSS